MNILLSVIIILTTLAGPSGMPDLGSEYSDSDPKATEIDILALRVQFETDSLNYTTGDGTFDSGYPDSLRIDGTPHDKEYFEDQLTFVKNYFESQSQNSVIFNNINVLDTVITLDHPIWYYNPNNGSEVLEERLYELYQSSWSKISENTEIDFADYDTFVIYHAGSGQEFSTEFDETPFDIPSVYFSSGELSGREVEAHDGTLINNSIILPECEWQTYNKEWFHAGMGGISCLMFAHSLGIPNLYSSTDGRSCIGRFGLMDQGSANFSGMVPSGVSGWVKELKGWSTVRTLSMPEDSIPAVADSLIYRIDINENEYFLIENRTAVNPSLDTGNDIFAYDRNGKKIRFYYNENGNQRTEVEQGFLTPVRIDDNDFDFGIPSEGILIWHIDKRKTGPVNIAENSVNNDYEDRGVYLEEADGSFDIGKDYWLLDNGYGTEFGWYYDSFFSNNEIWLDYSNQGLYQVEFSGRSYPASDTSAGIDTGILINEFSLPGRRMHFSFSYGDEDIYTLDPEMEGCIYTPLHDGAFTHHCFFDTSGNYKIFDRDGLLVQGTLGGSLSDKFIPTVSGTDILVVSSDSMSVYQVDISDMSSINSDMTTFPGKISAEPVDRIFPSENGVLMINEDLTFDNILPGAVSAHNISVMTGSSDTPVFVTAESGGILYSADISQTPYVVQERELPADSVNYTFIVSDRSGYNRSAVRSFPLTDNIKRLLWLDLDFDQRLENISSQNDIMFIRNDLGVNENGSPLNTGLDDIEKVYSFNYGSSIVLISTSGNYTVTGTGSGRIRTLGPSANNTGLFSIDAEVFLYSHGKNGVLTFHRAGEGGLEDYFDLERGTVTLHDPITPGVPEALLDGSVYNWPNPARGSSTNFRFYLNYPAEVEIRIYDINGNRVDKIKEVFTTSGEFHETVWDISDIPSGIYTAVIEFNSEKGKEYRKVKAAVIK